MVHGDLPLISPRAIAQVANALVSSPILVPSHDGGTSVVAGFGRFPFSYGIGSFRRHFAARPDALVMVSEELAIDIDTPLHLAAFPELVSQVA